MSTPITGKIQGNGLLYIPKNCMELLGVQPKDEFLIEPQTDGSFLLTPIERTVQVLTKKPKNVSSPA